MKKKDIKCEDRTCGNCKIVNCKILNAIANTGVIRLVDFGCNQWEYIKNKDTK